MFDFISAKKIQYGARVFVAYIHIMILFFLNLVSFSLPYVGDVRPFFFIMAVYYWAVFRPTLMPPFVVFILGVVMDIISGTPVGISSFVLLVVRWMISNQRIYLMSQSYIVIWLGFAFTCAIAQIFDWGIISLFGWHLIPIEPIVASIFLSIFMFPFVTLFLIISHRFLPADAKLY